MDAIRTQHCARWSEADNRESNVQSDEQRQKTRTQRLIKERQLLDAMDLEGGRFALSFELTTNDPAAEMKQVRVTVHPQEGGPPALFEIEPLNQYPFRPPMVRCCSPLGRPRIDDQRNVVLDVLDSDWSPSISCVSIVERLPAFLEAVGSLEMVGCFEGNVNLTLLDPETQVLFPLVAAGKRSLLLTNSTVVLLDEEPSGESARVIAWQHLNRFEAMNWQPRQYVCFCMRFLAPVYIINLKLMQSLRTHSFFSTEEWRNLISRTLLRTSPTDTSREVHGVVESTLLPALVAALQSHLEAVGVVWVPPQETEEPHLQSQTVTPRHSAQSSSAMSDFIGRDLSKPKPSPSNSSVSTGASVDAPGPEFMESEMEDEVALLDAVSLELTRMRSLFDDTLLQPAEAGQPSIEFIHRVAELYRRQVELMASKGDEGYTHVVEELNRFLTHPRVISALGGLAV